MGGRRRCIMHKSAHTHTHMLHCNIPLKLVFATRYTTSSYLHSTVCTYIRGRGGGIDRIESTWMRVIKPNDIYLVCIFYLSVMFLISQLWTTTHHYCISCLHLQHHQFIAQQNISERESGSGNGRDSRIAYPKTACTEM